MKLLIADPTDPVAIEYLKQQSVEVNYQPKISPNELLSRIHLYDALMVRSRTKVTQEVIKAGKNLKIVARIGSGYDNIDVATCKVQNIVVVNAPDANSVAVAELTIGLMISLSRQLPKAFISMKEGLWLKNELWGSELFGKTVGILGFGHVGRKVESLVKAFGTEVLVISRKRIDCTLKELFERADIVTIHLALNKETKGCVTKYCFEVMKPAAFLINISRGEIVDEEALYQILANKKIAGAALDVYATEPLAADSKWRKLDNVILTPHIGAATKEALKKASLTVAEDIVRVLRGEAAKNRVI